MNARTSFGPDQEAISSFTCIIVRLRTQLNQPTHWRFQQINRFTGCTQIGRFKGHTPLVYANWRRRHASRSSPQHSPFWNTIGRIRQQQHRTTSSRQVSAHHLTTFKSHAKFASNGPVRLVHHHGQEANHSTLQPISKARFETSNNTALSKSTNIPKGLVKPSRTPPIRPQTTQHHKHRQCDHGTPAEQPRKPQSERSTPCHIVS